MNELGNKIICGDALEVIKTFPDESVDCVITDPPYGISFMGKHWDYDVPTVELWKEVLRVLKPGGYLLSFAGTRTQHRMACNIEDAGFEIRDMIAWIYGSGFPKSLSIGKAVDKLQGNEREVIGENPNYRPVSGKEGYLGESNFRQTDGMSISTKGTSEWEGWGTALKPALEPITVARKPLSEKTVAENCLKWKTGGINIDGCRVETEEKWIREKGINAGLGGEYLKGKKEIPREGNDQGRFPANLIHDGSQQVLDLFPESKSTDAIRKNNRPIANAFGKYNPDETSGYLDSGSAARFFYCAKASRSEKNLGCGEIEPNFIRRDDGQPYGMNTNKFRPDGTERKETPPQNNNHPTVKPIKLMEYLVKLVSRENSIILDPFMGSGTTGIACKKLNRNFIGIEKDEHYFQIAEKRIERETAELKLAI